MKKDNKTKKQLVQELTELRSQKAALEKSESAEKYRDLVENLRDVIYELDSQGVVLYISQAIRDLLGYDSAEIVGKNFIELAHKDDLSDMAEWFSGLRKGLESPSEYRIIDKSGEYKWAQTRVRPIMEGGQFKGARGILIDVTAQRRTEKALRESGEYFKAVIQNSSDIILIVDKLGTITYASPSIERVLGYRPDELIGKRTLDLIVSEDKPRAIADFGRALLIEDVPIPNVFRIRHKDGSERILEGIGKNLLDNPIVKGFVMNVRDITDRKRREEEMAIITEIGQVIGSTLKIDQLYEQLVTEIGKKIPFDSLMVNLLDEQQETLTVAYFYGLEIPGRTVGASFAVKDTPFSEVIRTKKGLIIQSENPEDLLEKFPGLVSVRAGMLSIMTVPLIARKKLIGQLIIRSSKPVVYTENDLGLTERIGMQIAGAIANAQLFNDLSETEKSLRENERRFRSLFEQAAVGVAEIETSTGRFFTVNRRLCEMVGRTEAELMATTFQAITHPEDSLLHEEKTALLLAGEIDHYSLEKRYLRKDGGIVWVNITVSPLWKPGGGPGRNMIVVEDITERKEADKQLLQTLENLRAAMNTTVQVMVSAVEARDPYTSGHQIRAADLARSIATEMGLPQEKIDAIRMAGIIHDIGKLSIPAEILSKPTKLSDIEFSLIKEHARKGYEMLKDVESPWPLAEIVYEHHERMDGSGYPRNLKGDDILIEARILMVADVVEAMASHRPYRPGLGIDAALNEIEKNSGVFYDKAVADACLRLFQEKGFQLIS